MENLPSIISAELSGTAVLENGTSSTPSIRFADDEKSGIYRSSGSIIVSNNANDIISFGETKTTLNTLLCMSSISSIPAATTNKGYLYKKTADDNIYWKTPGGGETALLSTTVLWPLLAPTSTVAAPSYTFGGSTGYGMNLLANKLALTANSNAAIIIDSSRNVSIDTAVNAAYKFYVNGNSAISGTLLVTGDLNINGTVTSAEARNLIVEDPTIKLANGNPSDTLNIGVYGEYKEDATIKYAGLFRKAAEGQFYFWKNYTGTPTTNWVTPTLASINVDTVTATTLTGTLSTAAQTNITSLGSLAANLLPSIDNTYTSGSGSFRWSNLHSTTVTATTLTGTLSTAAQTNITSLGSLAANLLPSIDNTYTSGSGSFRWSNLHSTTVTAGTLSIGTKILNERGTAGAPSYSFTDDSDTGFYSSGNETIDIAISGSNKLSFSPGAITSLIPFTLTSGSTTGGELRLVNTSSNGFAIFNQETSFDFQIAKLIGGVWQYNILTLDYANGNVVLNKQIIPSGDNTLNLGGSGNRWANIFGNFIYGTIQTAAQPNITSLGDLTALTMAGSINLATNNITGGGTITATTLTGTLSTVSQPNITALGALAALTMTGAINSQNIYPTVDNTYALGSDASRYNSMYSTNTYTRLIQILDVQGAQWRIQYGNYYLNFSKQNAGDGSWPAVQIFFSNNDTINAPIAIVPTITSSTVVNANSIVLTNQSGSVGAPDISFFQASGGLYFHKNNQLVGLSGGTARMIELNKATSTVTQDYNTTMAGTVTFNNSVVISGAGTGITLPSVDATGNKILSYYEDGSGTLDWSGAFTKTAITYLFTRIGKNVTITFYEVYVVSGNVAATILTSTALPVRLRPTIDIYTVTNGDNNNGPSAISCHIQSTGIILCGTSSSEINIFTAETPTTGCGVFGWSTSYSIA